LDLFKKCVGVVGKKAEKFDKNLFNKVVKKDDDENNYSVKSTKSEMNDVVVYDARGEVV